MAAPNHKGTYLMSNEQSKQAGVVDGMFKELDDRVAQRRSTYITGGVPFADALTKRTDVGERTKIALVIQALKAYQAKQQHQLPGVEEDKHMIGREKQEQNMGKQAMTVPINAESKAVQAANRAEAFMQHSRKINKPELVEKYKVLANRRWRQAALFANKGKLAFDETAANKVLSLVKKYTVKIPIREISSKGVQVATPSLLGGYAGVTSHPKAALSSVGSLLTPEMKEQANHLKPFTGKILTRGSGDSVKRLGRFGTIAKEMSGGEINLNLPKVAPKSRKMLDAVIKGHELDETKIRPNLSARIFGHNSADVLMREHNRLTTLPKQYADAKNYGHALRAGTDREGEVLGKLIPGYSHGQSPRLSRHLRKKIVQKMDAENPVREFMDQLHSKTANAPDPFGLETGGTTKFQETTPIATVPTTETTKQYAKSIAVRGATGAMLGAAGAATVYQMLHKNSIDIPWKAMGLGAAGGGAMLAAIRAAEGKRQEKTAAELVHKGTDGLSKKHHTTTSDVCPKELKMGIKVEREHSSDPKVQKEIALDHLTEFPKYYTALAKMERELKKQSEVNYADLKERLKGLESEHRFYAEPVTHKQSIGAGAGVGMAAGAFLGASTAFVAPKGYRRYGLVPLVAGPALGAVYGATRGHRKALEMVERSKQVLALPKKERKAHLTEEAVQELKDFNASPQVIEKFRQGKTVYYDGAGRMTKKAFSGGFTDQTAPTSSLEAMNNMAATASAPFESPMTLAAPKELRNKTPLRNPAKLAKDVLEKAMTKKALKASTVASAMNKLKKEHFAGLAEAMGHSRMNNPVLAAKAVIKAVRRSEQLANIARLVAQNPEYAKRFDPIKFQQASLGFIDRSNRLYEEVKNTVHGNILKAQRN
jgi:hypothetical protein